MDILDLPEERAILCLRALRAIAAADGKLAAQEKRLLGTVYGSAQVRRDFPRLIGLVETGKLDLGDMVSRTITLDEVNDGLRAMQDGEVIRSVIEYS